MATPFQLGSISTGTLKALDLIPVLARLDPLLVKELRQILFNDADGIGFPKEILDALNNLCPPFVYFGAHPGDGADFGFWLDWDAIEELNGYAELDQSDTGGDDGIIVYLVSQDATPSYSQNVIVKRWGPTGYDIPGPITVMDLDRNILWSTV